MDENFIIEDESNDKKYFSMLPNYILNHSTAIDQSLYWNMKRHAGENGECNISEKTLLKKLGIGRITLKKSIEYLLAKKWIKFNGFKEIKTKGGIQNIKTYRVVDIWRLNTDFYTSKGVSETVGVSETARPRGGSNDIQGVSETAPKKNHTKEDIKDTKVSLTAEEKNEIGLEEKTKIKKPASSPDSAVEKKKLDPVNKLMQVFYEGGNPTIDFGNPFQRKAAKRMIAIAGIEKVIEIAKYAVSINGKEFAPTITTPLELKNKYAKLKIYWEREKNKPGFFISKN